ncbi:MAG TPA: hypothetical protein VFK68_09795, partial [Propionibacteriaceae bacterium]|nr:hypothetical protein [Propionibacteriaceae bacterium]
MTSRRWRLPALAAATAIILVAGPLPAHADNTDLSGDGVSLAGGNYSLNLGTVCLGGSASKTVAVFISRQGNYGSTNVFKAGT